MVLVTGGAGFLGSVLVKKLIELDKKVRILALKNEDLSSLKDYNVEIVYGDVRDEKIIYEIMDGVDEVYHLASMISITSNRPDVLYDINVNGAVNVAKNALKRNVKSMVYVSSIHSFADLINGFVIDETIPISPINAIGTYGKTKAIATLKIKEYVKKGLNCKIVCPSGIIGPFDYRPSRMGKLILDYLKGKVWYTLNGGYNFVDVRDVAEGCILASQYGKNGEVYLLTGEYLSFDELYKQISLKIKKEKKLIRIPDFILYIVAYIEDIFVNRHGREPLVTAESLTIIKSNAKASCKKAIDELGYSFRPINKTLDDTIEWFLLYFKDEINRSRKLSSRKHTRTLQISNK